MSRFQFIKPTSRKGGLLSGYTGDPSGIWSLRQRYELLTFPLLDYHPGAAAAYSLRSLSSSYTGPVVTVRRSSDDAEADFTASEVAGGALATWVGANDGFVTTWYDQSGNENNAVQATSGAQPKIVSSGNLVEENGRPAIEFDGSGDFLLVAHSAELAVQPSGNTFAAVLKKTSGCRILQKGNGEGFTSDAYFFFTTTGFSIAGGFGTDGPTASSQTLFFARWNGLTSALFKNGEKHNFSTATNATIVDGEIDPTLTPTANTDDLYIGRRLNSGGTSCSFGGNIQDLILWPFDIAAQRTDIEAEISQAYGI